MCISTGRVSTYATASATACGCNIAPGCGKPGLLARSTSSHSGVSVAAGSTSVARTTTLTVSGQTLANEVLYTDYPLNRADGGELTAAIPGVLADGTVPTWS